MSGEICLIIIRGNLLQALLQVAIAMWRGNPVELQRAIGNVKSLCNLGAGGLVYDGEPIMNEDQQGRASDMMQAAIDIIEPILNTVTGMNLIPRDVKVIVSAVEVLNADAEALLTEVSSGE